MRAAAVILALLAWPASAAAHTMTLRGAERVALRYAERVAASVTPMPQSTSVRGCHRHTRHLVHCRAVFRFSGGVACERTVQVRMTNAVGDVSRLFVGDLVCR